MRYILIIGAFLAGLVGLFMSVCGGGFFVMLVYNALRNIARPGRQDQLFGALTVLVIPGALAVGGAALVWGCFKFIRRSFDRTDD